MGAIAIYQTWHITRRLLRNRPPAEGLLAMTISSSDTLFAPVQLPVQDILSGPLVTHLRTEFPGN